MQLQGFPQFEIITDHQALVSILDKQRLIRRSPNTQVAKDERKTTIIQLYNQMEGRKKRMLHLIPYQEFLRKIHKYLKCQLTL